MKCHSDKIRSNKLLLRRAFSLIEAMAALIILAIVSASVLVIVNRSVASAADSAMKMQAFEVARENMESLLACESVSEEIEYGTSKKYPEIRWKTTVEAFYKPITKRIWVQAICSSEYIDSSGSEQKVELTHWLTDVSDKELMKMVEEKMAAKLAMQQDTQTQQDTQIQDGTQMQQDTQTQQDAQAQDGTQMQQGTQTQQDTQAQSQRDRLGGLPANWDGMTREEQLRWLFSTLFQ